MVFVFHNIMPFSLTVFLDFMAPLFLGTIMLIFIDLEIFYISVSLRICFYYSKSSHICSCIHKKGCIDPLSHIFDIFVFTIVGTFVLGMLRLTSFFPLKICLPIQ